MTDTLSERLLAWYDQHGRQDLPWKREPDPYRIWVSEIMLQQTQVSAVIPYFQRFMGRFPRVRALADAPLDEVLHLWSGLGYYARARNLHRAAQTIKDQHGGRLPETLEELHSLPGIGRSTAAAILALAHGRQHAILDGNVKRVLCRYHAIEGWPGESGVLRKLWMLAEGHTPADRVADYTQAVMDLGAMVCTRSQPRCSICPLSQGCAAHQAGREREYPRTRPRKPLPTRATTFVLARNASGAMLLEKRPPAGVWGGLWSFPECPPDVPLEDWCLKHLGQQPTAIDYLLPVQHTFTHFHLEIRPALVTIQDPELAVLDGDRTAWYKFTGDEKLGLPAPVSRLLTMLGQKAQGTPL